MSKNIFREKILEKKMRKILPMINTKKVFIFLVVHSFMHAAFKDFQSVEECDLHDDFGSGTVTTCWLTKTYFFKSFINIVPSKYFDSDKTK